MKIRLFLPALMALMAGLYACGPDMIYEERLEIPDGGGWKYQDTLQYAFEISDTSLLYNIYLDVEHIDSFMGQNLYLRLHTLFPDGRRASVVRSFDLFDAQGKPAGNVSGHWIKPRLTLQENAFFNLTGRYVITVEQYSRFDPLPGIRSAGIAIERTDQKRK